MKRSELRRLTPLTAKSALKRTTAIGHSPMARSALHADSTARKAAPKRRTSDPVPSKLRIALAFRSEGRCEIQAAGCSGVATDLSHRKKVGAGGRKGAAARAHHVLTNCLAACRTCHSNCHAAPAAAYWRGWMLREHEDPRAVPCLYRGLWVLLADDGSTNPIKTEEESPWGEK